MKMNGMTRLKRISRAAELGMILALLWVAAPSHAIEVEVSNGAPLEGVTRLEYDGANQQFKITQRGLTTQRKASDIRYVKCDEGALSEDAGKWKERANEMKAQMDRRVAELQAQLEKTQADLSQHQKRLGEIALDEPEARRELDQLRQEKRTWESEKAALGEQAARMDARIKSVNTAIATGRVEETVEPGSVNWNQGTPNQTPGGLPGLVEVSGRISHGGTKTFERVVLEITALDAEGQMVEQAYTFVQNLPPNEARPWRMDLDFGEGKSADKVAEIKVVPVRVIVTSSVPAAGRRPGAGPMGRQPEGRAGARIQP